MTQAFLETPRFPGCPSFGITSEPLYAVSVVERANGGEKRNRDWDRPRHRYTVTVGPRMEAEISEVLEFYHAVGGPAYGFRFKDPVDFKSCRVESEPSSTDQPLPELEGGSPSQYQLTKRYTMGANTQDREIYKPVSGSILIADAGVLKTEGADYDIDYTTGEVILNFTPSGALTWGGEFDVPARFEQGFPIEIVQLRIQSVTFTLLELRQED
jgi:uncharacterized protein (TIGR02217 family)